MILRYAKPNQNIAAIACLVTFDQILAAFIFRYQSLSVHVIIAERYEDDVDYYILSIQIWKNKILSRSKHKIMPVQPSAQSLKRQKYSVPNIQNSIVNVLVQFTRLYVRQLFPLRNMAQCSTRKRIGLLALDVSNGILQAKVCKECRFISQLVASLFRQLFSISQMTVLSKGKQKLRKAVSLKFTVQKFKDKKSLLNLPHCLNIILHLTKKSSQKS